jgi:hypothetical protein
MKFYAHAHFYRRRTFDSAGRYDYYGDRGIEESEFRFFFFPSPPPFLFVSHADLDGIANKLTDFHKKAFLEGSTAC